MPYTVTQPTVAHFIPAEQPGVWAIKLDAYHWGAIEVIRRTVPEDCRRWEKSLGVWGIHGTHHARAVAARLRADGHDVRDSDLPTAETSSAWAVELLEAAPADLRPKIVRALAKVLHPDAGGVQHLMADLNDAAREVAATS